MDPLELFIIKKNNFVYKKEVEEKLAEKPMIFYDFKKRSNAKVGPANL